MRRPRFPRVFAACCVIGATLQLTACSESALKQAVTDDGGSDASASLWVLAEGQHLPAAIAVDQRNVYWLNLGVDPTTDTKAPRPYEAGQIMKCAKDGCGGSPEVLASDRVQNRTRIPAPFATDGSAVYWSDRTEVPADATELMSNFFRCSVDGCGGSPEVLVQGGAERLAVHGGYLAWTLFEAYVAVCPTTGCATATRELWSAGYWPCSTGIAVDDSGVYWATEDAQILRCPLAGCDNAPTQLMTSGAKQSVAVFDLASDADFVYITDSNPIGYGMVLRCPKTGCADQPVVLARGLDAPFAIVSDGVDVYWMEDNQVRRCGVAGCDNAPTVVAAGDHLTALAVDDHYVYVADSGTAPDGGRIWRVPK
jgi:hypothetical protein